MKKKILFLMIFLVTIIFIGINIKGSEAKAEETCVTHWNYYLFQDASDYSGVRDSKYTASNPRTTTKAFALGVPSDAKNVGGGQVVFEEGDATKISENKIPLYKFYQLTAMTMKDSNKKTVTDSDGTTINSWVYCEGNNCFSTAKEWKEGDVNKGTFSESPNTYGKWSKYLSGTYKESGATTFLDVNYSTSTAGYFSATIGRYWSSSVKAELATKNFLDTDTIFSIGAYYVKYDVCTESGDPIDPEPPVTKENKVTTHYYIENTTTKLHDDKVDYNVPTGTYKSDCPETLKSGNKYYDRLKPSVSVEMPEEGEKELICEYREQTYTMTLTYGEDEDCSKTLQEPYSEDGLKAGQAMSIDVPNSIGKMTEPKLGIYSSQITNKPKLDGTKLSFTMPAKNVSICIVYTPQTGSSMVKWLALIGLGALAFAVWNISKKNNEVNNEA